jgi:uncharacterized protein YbjQ (UPF0145 family)
MAPTDDERTREEAREASESAADLAQGELPLQAQKRLAQETGAQPLFATDLNVGEFLLARAEGYDAVGQVMGSSIYHVGWQYAPGLISSELTVVTQAHLEARGLALGRLRQEAAALRAHGVVGVRLTTRAYEWGPGLLEFTAVGTAVRLRGAPPAQIPFLSDLSGEDFWTLVRAGYLPKGLAMGFSAYFVYNYAGFNPFRNQELTDYSAGVYQARHRAMQRLHADLLQLGADGVVGVKVVAMTITPRTLRSSSSPSARRSPRRLSAPNRPRRR